MMCFENDFPAIIERIALARMMSQVSLESYEKTKNMTDREKASFYFMEALQAATKVQGPTTK